MKKRWKRWLSPVLAVCLAAMMLLPVMASTDTTSDTTEETTASSSSASDDISNGVMQVWLEFVDDNKNVYQLSGGTCFLINDEYVLTNYHVVNPYEEYGEVNGTTYTIYDFCMLYFDLSSTSEVDSHLQISVYGYRDASVTAEVVENCYSETTDFAALKLSDKIGSRTVLTLGDSDTVAVMDTVISYGFPSTSIENKEYNSADDVSVTSGNVSKVTTTGSIDYIEHTADINTGNSGGPLVNEDGEVIGINSFMYTNYIGANYYAIQINTIKKYLDNAVISYTTSSTASSTDTSETDTTDTTAEEVTEEEETETASSETLATLNTTIAEAEAALEESSKYTEESVSALEDELSDAKNVAANEEATEDEVKQATDSLSTAIKALEEKSGISLPILIGIIVVVVIIIVVIIIIVVMNSKKKKKQAGSGEAYQTGGYTGAPVPPTQGQAASGQTGQQQNRQNQSQQYAANDGAGETTLLDSGAGETTLLGGGTGAYLIRKKNGEKITISKTNFSLGKERKRVDYCVSDNTSVSRYHAVITRNGTDFYITDQNSSNFTYVNGVQVSPLSETLLTDRSVIKLSDEEFEFHLS